MCSSCKMDPSEVAVMRARQGALDPEDFEKEVNYRPARKRKPRPPKHEGCPENEGKSHVYVWVPITTDTFYGVYGWSKREVQVCCGCRKEAKSRDTEKYTKTNERKYAALYGNGEHQPRGEPVGRMRRWRRTDPTYKPAFWSFSFESLDQEYKEAYNKYLKSLGYTKPWHFI